MVLGPHFVVVFCWPGHLAAATCPRLRAARAAHATHQGAERVGPGAFAAALVEEAEARSGTKWRIIIFHRERVGPPSVM